MIYIAYDCYQTTEIQKRVGVLIVEMFSYQSIYIISRLADVKTETHSDL